MFRKTDVNQFRIDLRKIALACIIGGLTGLFLRPYGRIFVLAGLFILGLFLWYIGLQKKEITRD
jgi:hypothetical protein